MTKLSNYNETSPVGLAVVAQADNIGYLRLSADAARDSSPAAKSILADFALIHEAIGNVVREIADVTYYKELTRKEVLSIYGKGPRLTLEERADLRSKWQFPSPDDEHYRALARKESLAIDGKGPELTQKETEALSAARRVQQLNSPSSGKPSRRVRGLGAVNPFLLPRK